MPRLIYNMKKYVKMTLARKKAISDVHCTEKKRSHVCTMNFPYGNKDKNQIIEYSIQNVERLISENVKMIVTACGTVTSQAIEILQEKYEVPIIGIIEPTVVHIKEKGYKKIGVIATEEKIKNIKVVNQACPMLATIAEQDKVQSQDAKIAIHEYMKKIKEEHIDKIIMGCTHYPIYEKVIKNELKYDVELINTGTIVAQYIEKYLHENEMQNDQKHVDDKIYLTKPERHFQKISENILKCKVEIKELITQ